MKKRVISIFLIAILILSLSIAVFASNGTRTAELAFRNIKITMNGHELTPNDAFGNAVEPFIIDGTTYLPVRAVANALGLNVEWDGATSTVKLSDPNYEEPIQTLQPTPITIRVMQFNIGRFDYGVKNEGLTEEEYQEKLPGYKRLFANYQPGILGLEEWEPYMDAAHLHESDAVLFDPIFPYSWHNDHTAIKTIYPIMYSTQGVLTPDLESSYRVPYTLCEYMINGKKVGVISAALKMGPKSGDTPEDVIPIRAAQLAYEMELLADYDYAIICNDLNCPTTTERDDMKTQIATAGFTVANGGYFPDEITHSSQLHDYYIDNILTKGLVLRNFEVLSDEYSNLSSDHYVVFADYVILET